MVVHDTYLSACLFFVNWAIYFIDTVFCARLLVASTILLLTFHSVFEKDREE